MAEAQLEALLTDFDERAAAAQQRLLKQREHVERFRAVQGAWLLGLLERVSARLERSGHEAEVRVGGDDGLIEREIDPGLFVQLRVTPRSLPGHRLQRAPDRQPLVRFQLDAGAGVVQVWARDVSLDGRDVQVGYRNGPDGQPLGIDLDALDETFVWSQVLHTLDFAMRDSAQEPLFKP